ncbi:Solute carrier family 35 member F3/F4 [Phytophthora cactorum]|nr:Solute carrier family 35 member F3/F4 [Phytophthora cactorum]
MTRVTDSHPAPHELTKLLSSDEISTETRQNLPKHAGHFALGGSAASIADRLLLAQRRRGSPRFCWCAWTTFGDPLPKLGKIAAFLSVFYAVTDYFWYAALANVSVAAGTAIFNCSPLFVYCYSICFLKEQLSFGKLCGVFTSFVGVTLVVVFQNDSDLDAIASTGEVAGLMVVLSAALYGGYEVAIRLTVGEDITDTATLLIMTGLSGLFTIPIWIAGSLLLAYSPIDVLYEPLGLPNSPHGMVLMLVSGLTAIVFCVFLPLSLCWTSPLETSVGCMLTIPLSGIVDTVIHHTSFSWECTAGSALVMAGFGILEYCSATGTPLQPEHNKKPGFASTLA